ncbi:MAG: winged helix-turn-helix transcriptional regulator [Candidatus Omnitrophica bacterium]|nr:winged helix-turn-helix transcriptional regulator [Candidatus Omnitrophota bacterium]
MLKDIFTKTTEQKILSLFVANPNKSFYGREISKKIKISLGATSNALRFLEKKGILTSERKGKTSLYTLKLPNPYIEHFKILNSLLVIEPLVERLKSISRRILLYGSYAAGTFTSESDLDLFIVSERRDEVLDKIGEFNRKQNIDIRPVIKKQTEWMQLEKTEPEFFNELNRGITLWEKPIDETGF